MQGMYSDVLQMYIQLSFGVYLYNAFIKYVTSKILFSNDIGATCIKVHKRYLQ